MEVVEDAEHADAVQRSLAADRAAISDRIATMSAELEAVASASAGSNLDDEHDPEGATIAFEREQLAAMRAQARRQLGEIDDALGRLAAGTYGRCETCGRTIAAARLDALPAARRCIDCATKG